MRSPRPTFDLCAQDSRLSIELAQLGCALKKSGRVATVILAGGEGSRLGLGPKALLKGTFSKDKETTLLAHLLEEAASNCPTAIFISPSNRSAIEKHIESLPCDLLESISITLVEQKMWPYLDRHGSEVYSADQNLVEGPRGNGEVFERLEDSGVLDSFEKQGINFVQILPIDNPKSPQFIDALLGVASKSESDVAFAAFDKAAQKNVGLLVEEEQQIRVREYVSLDPHEADLLTLANSGVYVLSLAACRRASKKKLKRHYVTKTKKIGAEVHSLIKQETFIFDAFELERAVAILKICIKNHYRAIKTPEDLTAFF